MRQNTKEATVSVKTVKQAENKLILQIADMFIGFERADNSEWNPRVGGKDLAVIESKFLGV